MNCPDCKIELFKVTEYYRNNEGIVNLRCPKCLKEFDDEDLERITERKDFNGGN